MISLEPHDEAPPEAREIYFKPKLTWNGQIGDSTILVCLGGTETKVEVIERMAQDMRRVANRRRGDPLTMGLFLEDKLPPPDGVSRDMLSSAFKEVKSNTRRFQVIALGGGFFAAANRAAAATFRLLSGGFPLFFDDDVVRALNGLHEASGVSVDTLAATIRYGRYKIL